MAPARGDAGSGADLRRETGAAAAVVAIGSPAGRVGDVVEVPVFLVDDISLPLAGIDVRIEMPDPGVEWLVKGSGGPDCRINPEIDKDSSIFRFEVPGSQPAPWWVRVVPPEATTVRGLILSFYNSSPIPAGSLLFTCRLRIRPAAAPLVPLVCAKPRASTTSGELVPVDCAGGGVIVTSATPSTPTPSPTRTPTQLPAPAARVDLTIGNVAGNTGDIVAVPVRMQAMNAAVVGVQVDVEIPNPGATFLVNAVGSPDCTVNPDLDKDSTAFGFVPAGCTPGVDCRKVRALVLSFYNADAMPASAELFSCRMRITTSQSGVVPLVCMRQSATARAVTASGAYSYATTCTGGGLIVTGPATSTPTRTRTFTSTPTASPTTTFTRTPTRSVTPSFTVTATATPIDIATTSATPSDTPSPTPPDTATPTASPTLMASRTATPIQCVGDCNGDGRVAVNELVRGVNIALGALPRTECPAVDRNSDGDIGIFELINAVGNALEGCQPPA